MTPRTAAGALISILILIKYFTGSEEYPRGSAYWPIIRVRADAIAAVG
jgi:hypothetical protein